MTVVSGTPAQFIPLCLDSFLSQTPRPYRAILEEGEERGRRRMEEGGKEEGRICQFTNIHGTLALCRLHGLAGLAGLHQDPNIGTLRFDGPCDLDG